MATKPANKSKTFETQKFEEPTLIESILVIICYILLLLRGHILELCWKFGFRRVSSANEPENTKNFVPLLHTFESFYKRQVYRPIRDCWNRPVCSAAAAEIDVIDRVSDDQGWTFRPGGQVRRCVNVGSYNYLGFAEKVGTRADAAESSIRRDGIAFASSMQEMGTSKATRDLEHLVARYLGQQDAIVFQMGFATNALNLPILADKYSCILSDEFAHASLVLGERLSGATIRVFNHNDMADLERRLQEAIVQGHPRTRRPFRKVIIVCEGIYSMEGTLVNLPAVIELKKKYKAYLYLDEAHSIGAVGPHARGVVDYFGCSFTDVDIMMGTFTKSFGAAGGYIAGSADLIRHLRVHSHSTAYGTAMCPPVIAQITAAVSSLFDQSAALPAPTREGQDRIDRLAWNTRYVRRRLQEARLIIYGNDDSPVIPIMMFSIVKMACFSRLLLSRNVAMVIAGWPATRVLLARARLCMSASHTKEMLDRIVDDVIDVAAQVNAPLSRQRRVIPREDDPEFYASYLSHAKPTVANGVKNGGKNGLGKIANGHFDINGNSTRLPNRAEANGHSASY